jgi:Putative peptidoglycan binding domain/LysM domain
MAKYHIVKQGEYLSKIASENGFSDYHTLWNHSENAELKQKRQNPNVLYPGDRLFIPDMETKEESGATAQRHRFRYLGSPLMLRIVVKDVEDEPITDTDCELIVGLTSYKLTTDGEGLIEQRIPISATSGKLTIQDMEIPLQIGYLDPIEEVTGWQARLNNLGYYAGPLDQVDEERIRLAVEEFQCDHGLKVDGVGGPDTQNKLKEVHGC